MCRANRKRNVVKKYIDSCTRYHHSRMEQLLVQSYDRQQHHIMIIIAHNYISFSPNISQRTTRRTTMDWLENRYALCFSNSNILNTMSSSKLRVTERQRRIIAALSTNIQAASAQTFNKMLIFCKDLCTKLLLLHK